jgi:HD-like signal output (HDOD) protein
MSTSRVIALLCEADQRQRSILKRLRGPETEVAVCGCADELYRLAISTLIDAVIVDHRRAEGATGLEVLSQLSSDVARPVTVLLGPLTPEERTQAASLGVSIVLPDDTPSDRVAAVTREALSSKAHGVSIPHAARMLVQNADALPPPALVVQVGEMLRNPGALSDTMAQAISDDARTSAELLELVPADADESTDRVAQIQQAVERIGIPRTAALILSRHLFDAERFPSPTLEPALEQRLRLRGLLMAATAFTYTSMTGQADPELAYVLALLQDAGVVILAHDRGARYRRIIERCATVAHLQLASYEQQELGFTHADVTAALLQKWELPPQFVRLALCHHRRVESFEGTQTDRELLQAMQFAEAIADFKDQATPQRRLQLRRTVSQWGGMSESALRDCVAQAVARTNELGQQSRFEPPVETEMDRLIAQVLDKSDVIPALGECAVS